ncbi:hypothetical protein PI124_g2891 [Phytophthora idaei]|nr:hypothetical protein PI125_g6271 [Phytophthora idaei]KAG3162074.1 hypothetical protein PI126_g6141 [Phytophthora idaei]KAG3252544.1 hypothetical protein PI124_g2891 [Phytophthora idaei]
MNAKRDELLRLVAALSGACKQDKNVLKDGELVDALETHGRRIARLRKQQKKMKTAQQKLNMSPSHGVNKTAKKLKEQVMAGESKAAEGPSKRRKLSLDSETKSVYNHALNASCLFPSIERQHNPKRESMGKWISSLQSNKAVSMNPTDAVTYYRPTTPTTVAVAVEVSEEAVLVNPLKTCQYNHTRRSVSPQLKTPRAVRAASPYKHLDRAASPNTVDLSASSTSTMASYYDDMYDEYSVSSETMRRYNRSASDRTPSFESMDWAPSDDDCDESVPFRSIADDVEQSHVSRVMTRTADARLNVMELHSESGAEDYYSAEEGEPTAESSSRVAAVHNLPATASSTEVVMEVLYGIMEHNENFKWLIDPVNQARVAKLVEYHLKEQQNGDVSAQAYEDEQFINELRAHVDELIHENLKIKTENVRLMGSAVADKNIEELKRRLAVSEEAVSMQEGFRRKAEAAFQSELESKSKLVSSLQRDLEEKDSQIAKLLQNGAELPEGDDSVPDSDVASLKNSVMEKDREICRLNFQLSTKQKLVDEIAKKVVQQLETTEDSAITTLASDLHLDMNMFLFKSVAEKQEIIDELKASLTSMEREVTGLEARVAKKSRETLLLKTKFKSMSSRLTEANVNMSRIQTENDRLVTSLKEKQGKMRDLIEFLEGKEKQVMHLEEQVNLRQTQLEHVMTEYEKMQRLHNTKKSTSGRGPAHRKTTVHSQ